MDDRDSRLMANWIEGDAVPCGDIMANGSPERCVVRQVMKCLEDGQLLVLEAVPISQRLKRIRQAETLDLLERDGVPQIAPWLKAKDGQWGVADDQGLFWQCRRFINSEVLPREHYALEEWRGAAAARWLRVVHQESPRMEEVFLITHYIHHLMDAIRADQPALGSDLDNVLNAMDFDIQAERKLPMVFSHGDFHPGNILWGDHDITAVIDWEFCGWKPICYDAANLLGCIGMDNPDWLSGPMASAFLRELQLPAVARPALIRYMVALRFAWMREWWHANNKPMIIQELDFMWLLLQQGEQLLHGELGIRN